MKYLLSTLFAVACMATSEVQESNLADLKKPEKSCTPSGSPCADHCDCCDNYCNNYSICGTGFLSGPEKIYGSLTPPTPEKGCQDCTPGG